RSGGVPERADPLLGVPHRTDEKRQLRLAVRIVRILSELLLTEGDRRPEGRERLRSTIRGREQALAEHQLHGREPIAEVVDGRPELGRILPLQVLEEPYGFPG